MISSRYAPLISKLIEARSIMPLDAGVPDPAVVDRLDAALLERLFGKEIITSKTSARLCVAGLWLLYDHLEECHSIAQSIETQDGSYWHAIMHRREGDFSNSKYWLRRVGEHEIFLELENQCKQLHTHNNSIHDISKGDRWDPFGFVDLCEKALSRDRRLDEQCRQIQQIEWRLLFDHCYRKAVST
jgi:hypothetical protein